MNLYIFQLSETEYDVALNKDLITHPIVEQWPLNTLKDAVFLATHGTAYAGASDKVSKIADLVGELMTIDPTFRNIITEPTVIAQEERVILKTSLTQRIKSWFFDRSPTVQ